MSARNDRNKNCSYHLYTINTANGIIDVKMVALHRVKATVKQMTEGLNEGETLVMAGFAANQDEARAMKTKLKEQVYKEVGSKVKVRRVVYGDWCDRNRFVDWRWSTAQGMWLYY
jgi:hypothetical protein